MLELQVDSFEHRLGVWLSRSGRPTALGCVDHSSLDGVNLPTKSCQDRGGAAQEAMMQVNPPRCLLVAVHAGHLRIEKDEIRRERISASDRAVAPSEDPLLRKQSLVAALGRTPYSKSGAPGRNRTCCLAVRRWEISSSDYQV
jgi:hypothetical protein